MNYKSFNLGDWIGHISGVIEDETTLDGNEMRDLVEFLSTIEQDTVPFDFELYQAGLMDIPREMIKVLDEIRAEIMDFEEELFHRPNTDYADYAAVRYCVDIIDKYKAERSEE